MINYIYWTENEQREKQLLPAVIMDLKQDFWSMRGHNTYLAPGRCSRKVDMHSTRAIPVAMGTTKQLDTDCTPEQTKPARAEL